MRLLLLMLGIGVCVVGVGTAQLILFRGQAFSLPAGGSEPRHVTAIRIWKK
jgi:hypothetical protein